MQRVTITSARYYTLYGIFYGFREVTRWSCGAALHYGLSMLNWEKMYGNTCRDACGNALKFVARCIMAYPCLQSFAISFSNSNFSEVERVSTHYQALQTWIHLNIAHYHNLNALPHALPHALLYIFSGICMVSGYEIWNVK